MGGNMNKLSIQKEVFNLGLSPKHKGFHYISDGLSALLDGRASSVEKALRMVGADPKNRRADRCMRYAIHYAWDVNGGRIKSLFPDSAFPPSPLELLHAMMWELGEREETEGIKGSGTKGAFT